MCLCTGGVCVDVNAGPYGGQKRVSDIPGAGVKASVSHPMWVLGTNADLLQEK